MGPEFRRNLWLELTPRRIVFMVGILALVFFAAAVSGPSYTPYSAAETIYYLIVVIWGARNAGLSIVGEIRDEYDVDEVQPVQEIAEGVLLVEGGVALSDLSEEHRIPLEETTSYRTLAGFLLARLERIPRGRETVVHEGYRFTIVEMDGRRIAKVRVEKIEPLPQPTPPPQQ